MRLNNKIYKCVVTNLTNMNSFPPFEVVGRGSETQLGGVIRRASNR